MWVRRTHQLTCVFILIKSNRTILTWTNQQDRCIKSDPVSGSIFASLGSPCPTHSPQIRDKIHLQLDRILAWHWAPYSCLQLHSEEITHYRPYISSEIFVAVHFLLFHLVSCTQHHTLKGQADCLHVCRAWYNIIRVLLTKMFELYKHAESTKPDTDKWFALHSHRAQ